MSRPLKISLTLIRPTYSMPTKLIFTVTNDLSYDQRMQRICSTLASRGYEVELVGRLLTQSILLKPQAFKQTRLRCWNNKGKAFYLEYNLRLLWYLTTHSWNVVCGIDLDTLLPAFIASKLRKKPCVYDAHELFSQLPELMDRPQTQKAWEQLEAFLVPKMKYAYTVNQSLATWFENKYQTPFAVVRNLPLRKELPLSEADSPLPISQPFILYQGAVNMGRGLEQLIEAMQWVNFNLVIAGNGDVFDRLKQQVLDLHLDHKIHFTGYLPPSQLDLYTQRSYFGVNLLENKGLNYYYSLANKFFDYIQYAKPQVCINFPEYQSINQTHQVALLVDSLEPIHLAQELNTLINDKDLYHKLQNNCLRAREVFHWEHEQETLVLLYQRIVGTV